MPATLSIPISARGLQPRDIFNLNSGSGIALTVVFIVCFIGPTILLIGLGTQRLLLRLERNDPELCEKLHRWRIHSLLAMYKDTPCERCTAYRTRNIEMVPAQQGEETEVETDLESIALEPIPERPEPAHAR